MEGIDNIDLDLKHLFETAEIAQMGHVARTHRSTSLLAEEAVQIKRLLAWQRSPTICRSMISPPDNLKPFR